jgi:hypothetical protein
MQLIFFVFESSTENCQPLILLEYFVILQQRSFTPLISQASAIQIGEPGVVARRRL